MTRTAQKARTAHIPQTAPLRLRLRRRELTHPNGYQEWQPKESRRTWEPSETALVLCDVWDHHTCRGAEERLERLLPRMAEVVSTLRERGVLIVHAPSDTMAFYEGTPARKRAQAASQEGVPPLMPTEERRRDDPPQPITAPGGGCDTCPDAKHPKHVSGMPYPWTREHPEIEVDDSRDAVSEDGREHYALYQERGIKHVLLMGVHTNMCIMRRTFAIKQMLHWGVDIALIRDLTDTMYSPADPPFVSHEDGTRLMVEYIEKFWCPTVTSDQVLA